MHAYFILRGIKHEMELTKIFLQAQLLKWNVKENLTDIDKAAQVQFALRPIELYEAVFPEPMLPQVMKMLNLNNSDKYGNWSFQAQMSLLRKMLGAEKFPDMNLTKVDAPFIPRRGVAVHPIGIKKDDVRIVDGENYQEAL